MPYEVVGLLGRGGMAVVELAIDADGRMVARKRLPLTGPVAEMELARRRLRREAQLLARLEHPGIVPLLAVEDDGADVILVMPALAASLADRVRTEGPLSPTEVWRIGHLLLDALGWAHRQGVVHRDIKPANVLFDANGRPALADFGIARAADLTHGLTLAGSLLGTPAFISPEQARGEPAGPHSDVFSLAATLAYALTGQGPYGDGDAVTLALRASRGEVRSSLPGVPPSLAGPLRRMLDPHPTRRPSAAALLGGPSGTEPGGTPGDGSSQPETAAFARHRRPHPPAPVVIPRPEPNDPTLHSAPARPVSDPQRPLAAQSPRPDLTGRAQLASPSTQRRLPSGASAPVPAPYRPPTLLRKVARGIARVLAGGPLAPRRLPWKILVLTVAAVVAGAAVWTGLALAGNSSSGTKAVRSASPPTSICAPLPYEGCGQLAAPHTDGLRCDPGWYDIDGNAANGCEASPDGVDHQRLVAGNEVTANLVPVGDVDTYPLHVQGESLFSFSCGGTLNVTLTAPPGVSDQVLILRGLDIQASALSTNGTPATASMSRSSCFGNGSADLTVVVRGISGSTGADYTLTRNSGW